jgi:uncharacterized phage protein gp47/JayE
MVTIRSSNEIILSLIDFFKLAQPDLDTKPGTVSRDLFIEGPASQLSLLYDELSGVSNKQSLRLVIGSDLDKLAKNFAIVRRQATPATGAAILTFASINAPIPINRGTIITASNGFSYSVTTGTVVTPTAINFYKSVATKFRDQLDFAGISDTLAVQVTVTATSAGTTGNIGKYSLSRANIPGVSNVTNVNSFTGGTDQETDAAFRNRILATFSGSSVGTALGYLNVALSVDGVGDAAVIEPGNSLMTRDGTEVNVAADGTRTIVSEGSGGKVDVIVLGSNLVENSESFIFRDKSNNNDPTSSKNNVVLGQIPEDVNKTINRKRIDDIRNGTLPAQPVDTILQVSGSVSGSNFTPKSVDSLGRVSGNYEIIKDTGVYSGSPFGFDTFHWISNKISLFSEDRLKGQFNGQDSTTFTDVLEIPQAQQTVLITNENSTVTSDRSIIQLLHTPATNVTRVFNVNTGERYIITNQNLDQTGATNTSGRIQISGNTLPSTSDALQVDYSWIVNFDQYSDYDGLVNTKNSRATNNSIDWGLSANIRKEPIVFTQNLGNNFYTGNTSLPISSVISANKSTVVDGYVELITTGTFANRLSIAINNLLETVNSVDSVKFKNNNVELYHTSQGNNSFSVTTAVVGIQIVYTLNIILPTDTLAVNGDKVTVTINSVDVFNSSVTQGSSSGTQITIPSNLVNSSATSLILETTYLTNVADLFSSAITSLSASRTGNGFTLLNNNGFNNFSPVNIARRENQIVQKNLSNQFYVDLSLGALDFNLAPEQVLSVVRLRDGYELWSSNHLGTIATGINGNYQLILSGFNDPVISDRVLVIYYANDIRRFQPFSFSNNLIKSRVLNLTVDPGTNRLQVPINTFTTQFDVSFTVKDSNSDIVWFTITDGELINNNDGTAFLTSTAVNMSTIPDLLHKKVKLVVPNLLGGPTNVNNDGVYDIINYNLTTNTLTITQTLSKLTYDQVSIIRLLDGQEVWNYSGTIDVVNNKLLLPTSAAASVGDLVVVMLFNYNNLRQAPTRIVGTTVDQLVNPGIITFSGTTLSKAENVVFTATNTGVKLNVSEALRKALKLSSIAVIPSNIKLAKILKVEKVVTASNTDDTVIQVLHTYDTTNSIIQNNLFFNTDMVSDPTLQALEFKLPNTTNNTLTGITNNLPTLGDKIRITFYFSTDNDSENLSYTRNGTLYTNKKFALINKIFVSSGFKNSLATRLNVSCFNQPGLGARYKVFYDYLAPKQNERIVIRYNYNKLISDVTFAVENSRPVNADVLVKAARETLLDLTINVVIDPAQLSSQTTILQNLRDSLVTTLTTTELGQIVDQPTIINVAQATNGIARARILYFNKAGGIGQVLKVQAQEDEFFSPNNIIINTETR